MRMWVILGRTEGKKWPTWSERRIWLGDDIFNCFLIKVPVKCYLAKRKGSRKSVSKDKDKERCEMWKCEIRVRINQAEAGQEKALEDLTGNNNRLPAELILYPKHWQGCRPHVFPSDPLTKSPRRSHWLFPHYGRAVEAWRVYVSQFAPQMTKAVSGGEQTTTEYPHSVWFHVLIVATGIGNCSKAPICSRHFPCTPLCSGVDFSTPGIWTWPHNLLWPMGQKQMWHK